MANTLSGKSERGKPKLLDEMRRILRLKHYSLRTETSYCEWVKRFILFHGKRHPRDPGPAAGGWLGRAARVITLLGSAVVGAQKSPN